MYFNYIQKSISIFLILDSKYHKLKNYNIVLLAFFLKYYNLDKAELFLECSKEEREELLRMWA